MTQLSRPYQVALAALGLLLVVWFFALRGHSSSTTASAPVTASQTPPPAASVQGAPSSVYHGSAPGVEGLTRAIAKAHEAVAESEKSAKRVEGQSAAASTATTSAPAGAAATAAGSRAAPSTKHSTSSAAKVGKPAASNAAAGHRPSSTHPRAPVTGPKGAPAKQVLVERALKEGKVAVVLFWNPKGSDDVAVHLELRLLLAVHRGVQARLVPSIRRLLKAEGLELDKRIAVFEAPASQITSFGSFTRQVQVYQTPTLLIVNKRGQVRALTGLTDAFSIEQAIDEARHD